VYKETNVFASVKNNSTEQQKGSENERFVNPFGGPIELL
jgi:hypothetical protein